MTADRRALLLVGSPRLAKSNSEAIGSYILERLKERGWETGFARIYTALKTEEGTRDLLAEIERSALLILAVPLYVDSSPAWVVRFMELVSEHRRARRNGEIRFAAVVNCGFPEAENNETALRIYRRFAREAGLDWAGGVPVGMGEIIGGRPLAQVGGAVRNLRRALDLVAESFARGGEVPEAAGELLAKRPIPRWLYTWMGNRNWKRVAGKRGVADRLGARPFSL